MTKGEEIIKGHTLYGTPQFIEKINAERTTFKLSTENVVLSGPRTAASIDAALSYMRRTTLKECLQIVHEEGCDFVEAAARISQLLYEAEWPGKAAKQAAESSAPVFEAPKAMEPVESALIVRPPIVAETEDPGF